MSGKIDKSNDNTMNKKKLFIIIDGNAIIHRAYHALPPLSTSGGVMVNAVYGFVSMLLKVINDQKPDFLAVSFDLAGGTFRDKIFTEYKATRVRADQELYDQIPLVYEVVRAFGIPIYTKEGYEADDVIGTIVDKIWKENDNVRSMIVTGDMDILQLIDENTSVYELRKGLSDIVIFDADKVREKYGFGHERIVDYKAFRGDPSDNIPGIRGIGDKIAKQLLELVGGLEDIYQDLERGDESIIRNNLSQSIIKKLVEGEKDARMSYELALIHRDVQGLDFVLSDAVLSQLDYDRLKEIFTRFGFYSLLKRLPGQEKREITTQKKNNKLKYKINLVNEKNLSDVILEVSKEDRVVLSVSSLDNSILDGSLPFLGVKIGEKLYYIDLPSLQNTSLIKFLNVLFDSNRYIIGHDIKQFIRVALLYGAPVSDNIFDTMIASFIVNNSSGKHDLLSVIQRELNTEISNEKNQSTLFGPAPSIVAEELVFISKLFDTLSEKIKTYQAEKLFVDMEMPMIPILAQMENVGIMIDVKAMNKFSTKISKRIDELTLKIWRDAGKEFNIASPVQLRDILFETMGLPTVGLKKGKTGYSTASTELEKLREKHPIIEKIEEYREIVKLQNTYVDVLPKLINKTTGRIHTTFNQAVTVTGRLSSSDPNLQNIPIRTELGREVRDMFIACEGYKLVSVDYSQIDLRVAAHLSEDKKLVEIFNNDLDVHTATAAALNGVKLADVTKEMRRSAKEVNFGVLYGMGTYGLASRSKISQEMAREFIDKYFEEFAGIRKYIDNIIKSAKDCGYVETLYGRRRSVPELHSTNFQLRSAGERVAINMPVQGTTAEIMKVAMINIIRRFEKEEINSDEVRLLLQVHDEILFEVKNGSEEEIIRIVCEEMENAFKFIVKLKVHASLGLHWGSLSDFENKHL